MQCGLIETFSEQFFRTCRGFDARGSSWGQITGSPIGRIVNDNDQLQNRYVGARVIR